MFTTEIPLHHRGNRIGTLRRWLQAYCAGEALLTKVFALAINDDTKIDEVLRRYII